jgi:Family of unknown function (DUF5995)
MERLMAALVDALVERMTAMLEPMVSTGDPRRFFHATYLRTTRAVGADLDRGGFVDPAWAERWDVAFAALYLDACDAWTAGRAVPAPWQVAFDATTGERLAPVRLVLLGMNAHVNYDLPQALLAVIDDAEFDDADVIARRAEDHRHIDDILVSRVAAEDRELRVDELPGDRRLLDRALTPFNRAGTKRFLKEARAKVWRNAHALSRARREDRLDERLLELEARSRDRVADLVAPGQVILKLARDGFGVVLSDA